MSRLRGWYGELSNIDKFTFIVAIFTGLLCIVAALQYLAFINSERPFLTTSEILMDNGEPSTDRQFSAQISLKNSGKHVAVVSELRGTLLYAITTPELPKYPEYHEVSQVVVSPISPGDQPVNIRVMLNPADPLA
jgi:hypothetical protein